jgi:hypothetical protein
MSYFEKADKMRAYINTTQRHGPSQALIDFINHGKDFGLEIGLESLNQFSTQTQHEIILSKMDPDALDVIGIESLSETIKKISNTAFFGGALAALGLSVINPALAIIPLGISLAGAIGIQTSLKLNSKELYTRDEVQRSVDMLNTRIMIVDYLLNIKPSSSTINNWEKVKLEISPDNKVLGKVRTTLDTLINKHEKIERKEIYSRSGWTESEFKRLSNEMSAIAKKVSTIKAKLESTMSDVNKLSESLSKNVSVDGKTILPIVKSYVTLVKSEVAVLKNVLLGTQYIAANVRHYIEQLADKDNKK